MKDDKHLLSDPAEWMTTSEFVSKDGEVSNAIGEIKITVEDDAIIKDCWYCIEGDKTRNCCKITKESENCYSFEAESNSLGRHHGELHTDRNLLFSKYQVENSSVNGFEVYIKDNDECCSYGFLYDGNRLIKTWRSVMVRMF